MREILFRGKRLDDGEWVYGSFCMDALEQFNGLCGVDGFIRLYDKAKGKMQTYEVDRETVGQYTGLKDKNGKRIFEGDIIRMNQNENDLAVVEFGKFGCVCTEDESITDFVHGWYYRPLPTDALSRCEPFCWPFQLNEMWIKYTGIEVIGNIHDNPELLKGGDDK